MVTTKRESKMKTYTLTGIILIVIGIIALAYQGITYTTREKVIDLGPIQGTADKTKTLPLPPIIGGIALVGGIAFVLLFKITLSVSAVVGFIALFGTAVENGIVLVTFFSQLRREGMPLEKAIKKGCELRLRPLLLTTLTTMFGLIPILLASGPGAEIQKPLAVVVLGGLISSWCLTIIVLPALYGWFEREDVEF